MSSVTAAQESTFGHSVAPAVVDRTASTAHHVVDSVADQALTGVGKVSGSLHVAVNHTADAVADVAGWVAHVPTQLADQKRRLASAAFSTVKAHPFLTLGGAIALGYVAGRLARR